MKPNILILDYSIDQFETPIIKSFIQHHFGYEVTALHITTEASFPNDLIERDFTHVIHTGSTLSINDPAPFKGKAVKYIKDLVKKIAHGNLVFVIATSLLLLPWWEYMLLGKHQTDSKQVGEKSSLIP